MVTTRAVTGLTLTAAKRAAPIGRYAVRTLEDRHQMGAFVIAMTFQAAIRAVTAISGQAFVPVLLLCRTGRAVKNRPDQCRQHNSADTQELDNPTAMSQSMSPVAD